ncbi:hypothetical protein DVA67_012620 [Solirubrobacter sp. CPCC 204708]|uniref:DUF4233 domain-containing protein n=1 Tax=Solirubrobacter deserti TaxID=2282478 RepID=A0ABT4RK83_9ACTN|nr:hypothetical protein [Solirubrobacter deserti]MBE2316819.1 hypothetical protein [Solirubrobacter deserti]MDA0138964.1 hypothetical protein [Solirubrobacter deserti]
MPGTERPHEEEPAHEDAPAAAPREEAARLEAAREAARRDFAREQAEADRAPSGMQRGYARGRARDEAIRAQLTPLGPDERPLGLILAIVVVLVICGANAILAATEDHFAYAAAFVVGGLALAAGLWQRIYAVVVLVEALLALAIVFAALSLLLAGSLLAAAAALLVIAVSGPVFWLLIRVMARLQVPKQ